MERSNEEASITDRQSRSPSSSRLTDGHTFADQIVLLWDADDTLWENNIHFVEATEYFFRLGVERGYDREAASSLLTATERRNIGIHGYGSRCFGLSLVEAFQALNGTADPSVEEHLTSLAEAICRRDTVVCRPGVSETLEALALWHPLVLVTKGEREEQTRKLQISGLQSHFAAVEIVWEKDPPMYQNLVDRYGLRPESTWMIGNSPRSDVNPAVAAGLNAILLPHPQTWHLEMEDIDTADERISVLERIHDVIPFFAAVRATRNENCDADQSCTD